MVSSADKPSKDTKPVRAVEINYVFALPASTSHPGTLATTGSYAFPIEPSTAESSPSSTVFYEALRDSIKAAKAKTGDDLTAWRDAVGDGEKAKEAVVKRQLVEEEADEDGEEAEGGL